MQFLSEPWGRLCRIGKAEIPAVANSLAPFFLLANHHRHQIVVIPGEIFEAYATLDHGTMHVTPVKTLVIA